MSIPDEVAVTGIGDFSGSKDFEPGLTTVRIPARTIGAKAAETIASIITTDDPTIKGALYPPELIVRQTSAKFES